MYLIALYAQLAEYPKFCVGLVLAYSGTIKLTAGELDVTMAAIPYMPIGMSKPAAMLLPIVELAIGFGVIAGLAIANAATIFLLLAFACVSVLVIRHRITVPCGCFGDTRRIISWRTVRLDVFLAVMVSVSAGLGGRSVGCEGALVSTLVLLLYLCAGQISENRRHFQNLIASELSSRGPA